MSLQSHGASVRSLVCACVCIYVCACLSTSRMMDKTESLSCFCQICVQQQSLTSVCVSFFLRLSGFSGNAGRQAQPLCVLPFPLYTLFPFLCISSCTCLKLDDWSDLDHFLSDKHTPTAHIYRYHLLFHYFSVKITLYLQQATLIEHCFFPLFQRRRSCTTHLQIHSYSLLLLVIQWFPKHYNWFPFSFFPAALLHL